MKSIFSSKTFWFNTLTAIVTIATAFGYVPNSNIAETTASVLIVVAPIVNIVLRAYTTKAVTF